MKKILLGVLVSLMLFSCPEPRVTITPVGNPTVRTAYSPHASGEVHLIFTLEVGYGWDYAEYSLNGGSFTRYNNPVTVDLNASPYSQDGVLFTARQFNSEGHVSGLAVYETSTEVVNPTQYMLSKESTGGSIGYVNYSRMFSNMSEGLNLTFTEPSDETHKIYYSIDDSEFVEVSDFVTPVNFPTGRGYRFRTFIMNDFGAKSDLLDIVFGVITSSENTAYYSDVTYRVMYDGVDITSSLVEDEDFPEVVDITKDFIFRFEGTPNKPITIGYEKLLIVDDDYSGGLPSNPIQDKDIVLIGSEGYYDYHIDSSSVSLATPETRSFYGMTPDGFGDDHIPSVTNSYKSYTYYQHPYKNWYFILTNGWMTPFLNKPDMGSATSTGLSSTEYNNLFDMVKASTNFNEVTGIDSVFYDSFSETSVVTMSGTTLNISMNNFDIFSSISYCFYYGVYNGIEVGIYNASSGSLITTVPSVVYENLKNSNLSYTDTSTGYFASDWATLPQSTTTINGSQRMSMTVNPANIPADITALIVRTRVRDINGTYREGTFLTIVP